METSYAGPRIETVKRYHNSNLADWDHQAALEAISLAPISHNAPMPIFNSQAKDVTHAHEPPTTTKISIQQQVEFLASDELEGRMTGSDGAKRAAEHIATQFSQLNLKPPAMR